MHQFVIFTLRLYVFLGSLHSLKLVYFYLNTFYHPFTLSLHGIFSYLFIGGIFNWIVYSDQITTTLGTLTMLVMLYINFCLAIGCFLFFCAQMFMLLRNQTPHEFNKGARDYDQGLVKNFMSVFGWGFFLHFLMPLPLRYRDQKELKKLSYFSCV